jgi:hypothetical protein
MITNLHITTTMAMTTATTAAAAAAGTAVVLPEIPRGEVQRYPVNGRSFCLEVSHSTGSAPTGGSSASTVFSQETIAAIASGDS